ncbi:E3 ubiquitin-protein ligase RNF8-like [Zingiber officinale]|uniref:E3 ubiquitin-protein ligase RNF8-like n=1 Tax=Zingiber officinale TaxID=94328 RepID=UPI001C4C35F4|nr:E3 ubiquitin-protein ligase RNF8-like [Zingiber officinale]
MAIDKNHDDDVYEILPVLEQEEPIATMTNEETREAVEEAEMPLTGYSTISYLVEEEEENNKSEEMVGYSTFSFMKEEEENKESEGQQRCSACEGRPRGTALIQCGHTFCRLCAREMWLTQFDCPLCHRPIHGILDIF